MKKLIYLLIIMSLTLVGCSNNKAPRKSNLTYGMVKSNVIKGKTSQSEIMQLFGAPNLVTKNKENNEVWSYNKMSVDQKSGSKDAWLILFGANSSKSSVTTSSFDFIVIFDKYDIVKDYSVIASNY
ncbi:MAG: hypothetical protein Q7K47_06310 [Fusobacterium sp. JB019]|nr:hypothetical protein [Fusobacterium sp. JB019]